jgi:hypothetical protein
MKSAAEKSQEANDYQINTHNIVQEPGHDQNENTGNQGYQRGKAHGDVHTASFLEKWSVDPAKDRDGTAEIHSAAV